MHAGMHDNNKKRRKLRMTKKKKKRVSFAEYNTRSRGARPCAISTTFFRDKTKSTRERNRRGETPNLRARAKPDRPPDQTVTTSNSTQQHPPAHDFQFGSPSQLKSQSKNGPTWLALFLKHTKSSSLTRSTKIAIREHYYSPTGCTASTPPHKCELL